MLLRPAGDGVLAISQPAHAWVAGLLAQAWGNARFARPSPRQDVCLAAGLHDIGWLDWELAPELDLRTGWPRVFADLPAEAHTALWRRGVEHAGVYSRYAALLVSMHGDTIYDKTFDATTARREAVEAVRAFREDGARFQREAIAALCCDPAMLADVSDANLGFNKRLLAAVDTCSLQLCWGVNGAVTVSDIPTTLTETVTLSLRSVAASTISVDPWPFARPSLRVRVQARKLEERFYSQRELDVALRAAEPITLTTTLLPQSDQN